MNGAKVAGLVLLAGCAHHGPLAVELSWNASRADLDVHVSDQPGEPIFGPHTVNWCNHNAEGRDGARLDIDDRGGFGPELVVVDKPAGEYGVKVHYYAMLGDDQVVASVVIRSDGKTVWEGTQAMSHKQVWNVGVVLPDATFEVAKEPLVVSDQRGCAH